MKTLILSTFFIFLLAFSATAQAQTGLPKTDETLLRVEIEGGKVFELKTADLAKLLRREVKGKTHGGKESSFGGVDLREVLKLAGVKFGDEGKKINLVSYLTVEAADKYRAVFAMTELEPDFTDKIILLADSSDGKPLSKDEGKLRLVVPDEKKQARWVRQVVKLTITNTGLKNVSSLELNKSDDENLIHEVIFRTILKPYTVTPDKKWIAYYLAVDGNKDPNDDLLKKFTGYTTPVKKSSDSLISEADGSTVLDVETELKGVLFSVSKITWINNDEAKVSAGSHIGNMGSDGCSYTLKRENGIWKIASKSECFIS